MISHFTILVQSVLQLGILADDEAFYFVQSYGNLICFFPPVYSVKFLLDAVDGHCLNFHSGVYLFGKLENFQWCFIHGWILML